MTLCWFCRVELHGQCLYRFCNCMRQICVDSRINWLKNRGDIKNWARDEHQKFVEQTLEWKRRNQEEYREAFQK